MKKKTTTKKPVRTKKPELIRLVIVDEDGQRSQDSFSLDVKLLIRQSKTMSRVLYHAHKGLGYVITPSDRANLEGVFEMLNSVLDRVES